LSTPEASGVQLSFGSTAAGVTCGCTPGRVSLEKSDTAGEGADCSWNTKRSSVPLAFCNYSSFFKGRDVRTWVFFSILTFYDFSA
jgi:hypothetical protein